MVYLFVCNKSLEFGSRSRVANGVKPAFMYAEAEASGPRGPVKMRLIDES